VAAGRIVKEIAYVSVVDRKRRTALAENIRAKEFWRRLQQELKEEFRAKECK